MHDDSGGSVRICGFAAVWGTPSGQAIAGIHEYVAPGAFHPILGGGSATVRCLAHHCDEISLGAAELWSDSTGLAFETEPLQATLDTAAVIASILSGECRGVSWGGRCEPPTLGAVNGEPAMLINQLIDLDHISLVAQPRFPATACWLSSEDVYAMEPRLQDLARRWESNKPKGTTLHRAVDSKLRSPRARYGGQQTARPQARATSPAIDDADWCIPPSGWSRAAWQDFGRREAAGRRDAKAAEQVRWARQREAAQASIETRKHGSSS